MRLASPMRLGPMLALALLFHTGPARGAAVAHLAWDDCAAAGTSLKTFACGTNSGSETLVISFVPPAGITGFQSLDAHIQIATFDGTLPDWWSLGSGGCRQGALSANPNISASLGSCQDPWSGAGVGGVNVSGVGDIEFVAARASAVPLDPNLEYYAGAIIISNAKSSGAGACAGCSFPRGLYLSSLVLQQTGSSFDYGLYSQSRETGMLPAYVNWQCDGQPSFNYDAQYGWFLIGWDSSGCPTPARRTTWGAVKSLYR